MAQVPFLVDINLSSNQLLNAKMQNLGIHPFTAADASKKGFFYYNTTDSAAYIWDGANWDLMSEADMPSHTFKGNNTASSGAPLNLTATQLTAELNLFSPTLKGLVPLSGGGTTNFLRADGTWSPLAPLAYPGAGIAVSTGSAWGTSITDNSTNWNTAYTNRISSLTTTGSSGAATLVANVLNIPNYTLSGLGGQPLNTNLTSLSGLSYTSASFIKMTAAGTFALDTNTYLTSVTAHNLLSSTHGDTLADTVVRGDLMVGNATPKWSRLAFPTTPTGKILQATATDVAWSTNPITIGASASISGSNTGDQTSIVGIAGTKAQFNTAVTDGDIVYLDSVDTISGAKTFLDTKFILRNVANTFNGTFTNTNTANRVYTLQDADGTVAFLSDIAAAVVGGMVNKGAYDASTNTPNLDATPIAGIKNGWTYTVSVAGTFFTQEVQVGDVIIANADSPTLESQWTILNKNIPDIVAASETAQGIAEIATQAEITTGTDDSRIVTPLKLRTELSGGNWVYTAPSFGNGVLTTFAFTHGLVGGSLAPTVLITDTTTKMVVQTQVVITSSTVVTIDFNTAPTANQYTVVIKK